MFSPLQQAPQAKYVTNCILVGFALLCAVKASCGFQAGTVVVGTSLLSRKVISLSIDFEHGRNGTSPRLVHSIIVQRETGDGKWFSSATSRSIQHKVVVSILCLEAPAGSPCSQGWSENLLLTYIAWNPGEEGHQVGFFPFSGRMEWYQPKSTQFTDIGNRCPRSQECRLLWSFRSDINETRCNPHYAFARWESSRLWMNSLPTWEGWPACKGVIDILFIWGNELTLPLPQEGFIQCVDAIPKEMTTSLFQIDFVNETFILNTMLAANGSYTHIVLPRLTSVSGLIESTLFSYSRYDVTFAVLPGNAPLACSRVAKSIIRWFDSTIDYGSFSAVSFTINGTMRPGESHSYIFEVPMGSVGLIVRGRCKSCQTCSRKIIMRLVAGDANPIEFLCDAHFNHFFDVNSTKYWLEVQHFYGCNSCLTWIRIEAMRDLPKLTLERPIQLSPRELFCGKVYARNATIWFHSLNSTILLLEHTESVPTDDMHDRQMHLNISGIPRSIALTEEGRFVCLRVLQGSDTRIILEQKHMSNVPPVLISPREFPSSQQSAPHSLAWLMQRYGSSFTSKYSASAALSYSTGYATYCVLPDQLLMEHRTTLMVCVRDGFGNRRARCCENIQAEMRLESATWMNNGERSRKSIFSPFNLTLYAEKVTPHTFLGNGCYMLSMLIHNVSVGAAKIRGGLVGGNVRTSVTVDGKNVAGSPFHFTVAPVLNRVVSNRTMSFSLINERPHCITMLPTLADHIIRIHWKMQCPEAQMTGGGLDAYFSFSSLFPTRSEHQLNWNLPTTGEIIGWTPVASSEDPLVICMGYRTKQGSRCDKPYWTINASDVAPACKLAVTLSEGRDMPKLLPFDSLSRVKFNTKGVRVYFVSIAKVHDGTVFFGMRLSTVACQVENISMIIAPFSFEGDVEDILATGTALSTNVATGDEMEIATTIEMTGVVHYLLYINVSDMNCHSMNAGHGLLYVGPENSKYASAASPLPDINPSNTTFLPSLPSHNKTQRRMVYNAGKSQSRNIRGCRGCHVTFVAQADDPEDTLVFNISSSESISVSILCCSLDPLDMAETSFDSCSRMQQQHVDMFSHSKTWQAEVSVLRQDVLRVIQFGQRIGFTLSAELNVVAFYVRGAGSLAPASIRIDPPASHFWYGIQEVLVDGQPQALGEGDSIDLKIGFSRDFVLVVVANSSFWGMQQYNAGIYTLNGGSV